MKWSSIWHKRKGQAQILALLYVVVGTMLVLLVVPMINSGVILSNVEKATDYLTGQGYVVLAAGEYSSISTKLDNLKISADAAVVAAENAVVAAELAATKVDLFNSAEVYLYPATTNLTCTFTAGNTNVWSAWAEVVDSGATTLSSSFAADVGYVSDMLFFLPSDASDGYNVELAYGDAKTTLGRVGFWALATGDIAYVLNIKSRRVPAGETIYYRMQSTGANGATIQARFRYFYE